MGQSFSANQDKKLVPEKVKSNPTKASNLPSPLNEEILENINDDNISDNCDRNEPIKMAHPIPQVNPNKFPTQHNSPPTNNYSTFIHSLPNPPLSNKTHNSPPINITRTFHPSF